MVALVNVIETLMMSTKLATPGLLNLLWNKGYDVIFHVYDVTNKILSFDLNHVVDVANWSELDGNFSISMREVIIRKLSFYKDLTRKTNFLRDNLGSRIQ